MAGEIVRCPYCVLGDDFRQMFPLPPGGLLACLRCGHTTKPDDPDFICSCPKCTELRAPRDPYDEHIMRILSEANEPLFPSEIAARLNKEIGPNSSYKRMEVLTRLKALEKKVARLPEGRWRCRTF
jgi:hypothetical protein